MQREHCWYIMEIQLPLNVVLKAKSSLGMYMCISVYEGSKWYSDVLTALWRHHTKRTLTTYMPHYTHSRVYNNPLLPDACTHSYPHTHTCTSLCTHTKVCAPPFFLCLATHTHTHTHACMHTRTHKHTICDSSDVMGSVRQEAANI